MKDLDSRIATLQHKIDRAVARLTKDAVISSGSKSNFKLNPPIDIEQLIEIENQYAIKFPAEYRAFITKIANGCLGLLSIEKPLQHLYGEVLRDTVDFNFLKIPFTHTSPYNFFKNPYVLELEQKCDRGEISESEFSAEFDLICKYSTAGTIAISLDGCGYYLFLVITGATRGQVWLNTDAGDGGYIPQNLGFFDWYEKHLDNKFIQ